MLIHPTVAEINQKVSDHVLTSTGLNPQLCHSAVRYHRRLHLSHLHRTALLILFAVFNIKFGEIISVCTFWTKAAHFNKTIITLITYFSHCNLVSSLHANALIHITGGGRVSDLPAHSHTSEAGDHTGSAERINIADQSESSISLCNDFIYLFITYIFYFLSGLLEVLIHTKTLEEEFYRLIHSTHFL